MSIITLILAIIIKALVLLIPLAMWLRMTGTLKLIKHEHGEISITKGNIVILNNKE